MRRDVRRIDPELVVTADLGGSGFGLFVHLMGIGEESPFTMPGRGPRPRDLAPVALALAAVAAIATCLAAPLGIVYASGGPRAASRPGAQATVETSVGADGTERSSTRRTSPGS